MIEIQLRVVVLTKLDKSIKQVTKYFFNKSKLFI